MPVPPRTPGNYRVYRREQKDRQLRYQHASEIRNDLLPLRPVGKPAGPGSLRVPVSRCFCFSIIRKRFLHSRSSAELFGRHEILLSALDREHVADHFPGNG
jgi:hypothetical protein